MRGFGVNFVEGDFKEGCGAARRLWRIQQGGAGAAVAERKRRTKARRAMRAPQPVKHERQAQPCASVAPFDANGFRKKGC